MKINALDVVGRPAFKIVLVYDGFSDLIRAHETWSTVADRFRKELEITSSAWNFAGLREPRLRRRAARKTAEAHMVLLAASGRGDLPNHVLNWLGDWLPRKKDRHDALVAVLDRESRPFPASAHLCDYLRQKAQEAGMDFFCNTDSPQSRMAAATGT